MNLSASSRHMRLFPQILQRQTPQFQSQFQLIPRYHSSSPSTTTIHLKRPSTKSPPMPPPPPRTISISQPAHPSPQPPTAHLKAHHNPQGKGFINPWPSWRDMNMWEIFKWGVLGRLTGERKFVETSPADPGGLLNVRIPGFGGDERGGRGMMTMTGKGGGGEGKNLRTTWLGHASFYVEFPGGLRVLFDPVFTPRCSPLSFLGPKRYTPPACGVQDLPRVDVVVISHCHYDHLSYPTLVEIRERWKGDVLFCVPLGVREWFVKNGFEEARVLELDWWEERVVEITLGVERDYVDENVDNATAATEEEREQQHKISATISCLPSQHMAARTPFDKAQTLWSSWSITSGNKKVWFAGDTGYRSIPKPSSSSPSLTPISEAQKFSHLPHCPAFHEIGSFRGPFDLGLIPIGAYSPRWIMSPMHANPFDAVEIFVETKCRRALGMHWGTWVLTDEEVMEPPRLLREAIQWKGLEEGVFEVCGIGEEREF